MDPACQAPLQPERIDGGLLSVARLRGAPDLLDLHRLKPSRYPHLLESVLHGSAQARYDILFAFPGESLELTATGKLRAPAGYTALGEGFLEQLDHWWGRERIPFEPAQETLPFRGGWFVYLGYEMAGQIETSLTLPPYTQAPLPRAYAVRIPAAMVLDHDTGWTYLVAEPSHAHCLEPMLEDLRRAVIEPACIDETELLATDLNTEPASHYLRAVQHVQRYIREGDVFQVNLSRKWTARLRAGVDGAQIYRRLRRHNPATFAGLSTLGSGAVISSSPERLVCIRGDRVETRPIAGTHPRAARAAADRAQSRALLRHPKERAEHVMLIDLERNDLGRVCVPGSIEVDELMGLETYAHVHHIVSNIRGRLRAGVTPGQVVAAVFPGGTITGCPKVRCMEIIAELEGEGRGPYTGSFGYLNRDGDLDLNILIRSIHLHDETVAFRAGAGIVADSVPEREVAETDAKARGLALALAGERRA